MAATQILERERARLRAAGSVASHAQVLHMHASLTCFALTTCTPAGGQASCYSTRMRELQQPAQAPGLPPRQELAPPQLPPVRAASSAAAAASVPHAVVAGASAQALAAASDLPVQAAAGSRPCQPPAHSGMAAQQPGTQHASGLGASHVSPPRRAQEGGPCADPEQGHRSGGGGGGGWAGFSGVLALGGSGDGGRRPAGPSVLVVMSWRLLCRSP